jgi:hypothetical protein
MLVMGETAQEMRTLPFRAQWLEQVRAEHPDRAKQADCGPKKQDFEGRQAIAQKLDDDGHEHEADGSCRDKKGASRAHRHSVPPDVYGRAQTRRKRRRGRRVIGVQMKFLNVAPSCAHERHMQAWRLKLRDRWR